MKGAFVAKSEIIAHDGFDSAVARNRGFWAGMFNGESDAERWLLDPLSP